MLIVNGYSIERGANLYRAELSGYNLRGVDLRESDLRWANLGGADLRSASLRGANLRGANLIGANLSAACLDYADLYEVNLRETDLLGADLIRADLRHTDVYAFSFGRHFAYVHRSAWKIGCQYGTLDKFDEDYLIECAKSNKYTEAQITMYRDAFRYLIKKVRSE